LKSERPLLVIGVGDYIATPVNISGFLQLNLNVA
jgi:hypothetical protein